MVHKRITRFIRKRRISQPRRARAARARAGRIVSKVRRRVRKVRTRDVAVGIPAAALLATSVSPVGKAVTVGRGVLTGIKTLAQRTLGNPLAGSATIGAGLKSLGKRVGGRALGLGIAVEAFQFTRARGAGTRFDPIPDLGIIGAFALNPLAALGGLAFGTGEKGIRVGGETIRDFIANQPPAQDFQPFDFPPGFGQPGDVNINFPSEVGSFAPSTPQPPVGAFFPSIDLQVGKVGGGQNELLRLLLLLLGAGGLGALLGRKSKKKKTKKNKKDDDDE